MAMKAYANDLGKGRWSVAVSGTDHKGRFFSCDQYLIRWTGTRETARRKARELQKDIDAGVCKPGALR